VRGVTRDLLELGPEQLDVLRRCQVPTPAADLASDLDLPLGVIRILVSDLRELGLVTIHQTSTVGLTDTKILKDVADGLRRI
jgi:predicted transcriptional regulator